MMEIMPSTTEMLHFARKAFKAAQYHVRPLLDMAVNSAISDFRFTRNQRAHSGQDTGIDTTKLGIHQSSDGNFQYWIAPTKKAGIRGGEMPWEYMQGICDGQKTAEEKKTHVLKELARLPQNASFTFHTHPDLRDADIIKEAFAEAGFRVLPRHTLVYKGNLGEDPIAKLPSNARSNVKTGRRDLEITSMDSDDFFDFYRKNLEERTSHFFLDVDQELMKAGINATPPHAEIIAARRKTIEGGEPYPVDAAILCGLGSDRTMLLRISFRKAAEGDNVPAPHPQAVKMLVVEAMKRANERGVALDVSGYTPGGQTVYERFGVFEPEEGLMLTRRTFSRVKHYWQERHWG